MEAFENEYQGVEYVENEHTSFNENIVVQQDEQDHDYYDMWNEDEYETYDIESIDDLLCEYNSMDCNESEKLELLNTVINDLTNDSSLVHVLKTIISILSKTNSLYTKEEYKRAVNEIIDFYLH